ncbi:MAG TPA: YfcE family phosphodiesterase [Bacillota bacterium]|nr:YfcE family phosphodiesterase [Bacillota bacterium]
MKIIVFSDSHGNNNVINQVLSMHADTSDYAIHLGDGAYDFLEMAPLYKNLRFVAVAGNCDKALSTQAPASLVLDIDNVRLFLCHGHKHGVKFGTARLIKNAAAEGADIALFGHTHKAYEKYIPDAKGGRPIRLFNPGAAVTGSFGLIEIKDGSILMSHGVI